MSSGDHTETERGDAEYQHHSELLQKLLDDSRFEAAVRAYTKENDSYDIPFLGGSNNSGTTVYFDRQFVTAVKAGQVKYDGRSYDPRPFLKVHETVEGAAIRLLNANYDTDNAQKLPGGHLIATWAERRAVEHAGLDWTKYQDSLKPFIKTDEAEKAVGKTPPDLLTVPYHGTVQNAEVEKDEKPMADLTPDKRRGMPQSQFALPGKRFPMNDPTHQRLAISGATRSANAGNISQSTADRIKAEARAKLGQSPGGYVPNPAMAHPRMQALTMAAATHLRNAGHLPAPQAAQIHAKARANLNQMKKPQQAPQQPMPFGSLAPMLPPQGNGQPQ